MEHPHVVHDRRRGPRRVETGAMVDFDRRQSDRRARRPGWAALFGAIVGMTAETEVKASMSSTDLGQ